MDKLRARLLLQGRKLKQDELIDFIITLAEASPIIYNQGKFKGLTSKEKGTFFSFTLEAENSTKSIDSQFHRFKPQIISE